VEGPIHVWLPAAFTVALLFVLLWSCRGAPLGTPVADDFLFLARLRNGHLPGLFDSMGASWYWRPLSRQLYFTVLAPWLFTAPWIVPALHLALLGITSLALFRATRHFAVWPVAAAVAAFPLTSEPIRTMVTWPSGAQHLLALAGISLALHEILSGRRVTAALALLAAFLSHELAVTALPLVALVAWRGGILQPAPRRWAAGLLLPLALWAAGRAIAAHYGASLPPHGGLAGFPWGQIPRTLGMSVAAQLNLEELPPLARTLVLTGYGSVVVGALALCPRAASRRRLRAALPVAILAACWFLVGAVPFAALLPDWNGWHLTVPGIGLALTLFLLLGAASPSLALLFAGVRLGALLLAPPAPATVSTFPPATVSNLSFAQVTRLQRIVGSTRAALLGRYPRLKPGAIVRFWNLPLLAEVGFAGQRALRLWYGDSNLVWAGFGGKDGWNAPRDVLVEYDVGRPWPATVIEPHAVALYLAAGDRALAGFGKEADSLLIEARRAQPGEDLAFFGLIDLVRAQIALKSGNDARADSLIRSSCRLAGPGSSYWLLTAVVAQRRGDRASAVRAVRECLALDPRDPDGLRLARGLGLAPPQP
jgi:hypothetical protein